MDVTRLHPARVVLDPTSEARPPQRERPARPRSFAGITVGLLDISKPRGDVFLDRLEAKLRERGIATRRGIMASHLEKTYTTRYGKVSLPVTEEAARTTMLIPLYATMTEDEQTYVIEALREELGPA